MLRWVAVDSWCYPLHPQGEVGSVRSGGDQVSDSFGSKAERLIAHTANGTVEMLERGDQQCEFGPHRSHKLANARSVFETRVFLSAFTRSSDAVGIPIFDFFWD